MSKWWTESGIEILFLWILNILTSHRKSIHGIHIGKIGDDGFVSGFSKSSGKTDQTRSRKGYLSLAERTNMKPTAMIDISAGFSSEIFHLYKQSNVGCQL